MEYYYDGIKDTDEAKYYRKPINYVAIIVIFATFHYYTNRPVSFIVMLYPIIFMVLTFVLMHKFYNPIMDFISLENDILSWKFQADKNSIDLNKMNGFKENSNHLLFTTEAGDSEIFPSHNIESGEKYNELVEVLKKKFS